MVRGKRSHLLTAEVMQSRPPGEDHLAAEVRDAMFRKLFFCRRFWLESQVQGLEAG